MEACVRGFSYMPPSKIDANLQYIEGEELQRAWKVNRRQRLKEQEQRIWEEFVKEQDIVRKAYNEDPYQFLHDLPETCLKELMEVELAKLKREKEVEDEAAMEAPTQGEGDPPGAPAQHSVAFAEDTSKEERVDMFHIFDDDNDLNQSGDDGDESPSTVRERCSDDALPHAASPAASTAASLAGSEANTDGHQTKAAEKPAENVSNVIESSIYCARVKDIRIKIGEEMVAIMASLEVQDVMSCERVEVSRRCRRAAEFTARFNRIYMYQLQRQVHNIKRHVSQCLPLAQHTHFQSQMLRVVSLHQNMLQALQVFHKSFPATSCLRECGRALSALCGFVREASALCGTVPAPRDFAPANKLYNDELLQTCDKLDSAVNEYALRVADFLSSTEITVHELNGAPSSTKTKKSKKNLTYTKTGTKSWSTKDTDARLSMYSLDTLRATPHARSSNTTRYTSGTSKGHAAPGAPPASKAQPEKGSDKPSKKIVRRPLMRAPQSGAPRPRARRQDDIATMVEAVDTCESCHMMSACVSPRQHVSRQPEQRSPRNIQKTTPRSKQRACSPKCKPRRVSPKTLLGKKSYTTIESETVTSVTIPITPVTKIQCSKKQPQNMETSEKSPRSKNEKNTDRSGKKSSKLKDYSRSPVRSGKSTDRSRSEKYSGLNRKSERADKNGSRGNKKVGDIDKEDVYRERHYSDCEKIESDDSGKDDKVYGSVERPGSIGNPGKEDNTGREFCGVKELTDNDDDYSRSYAREVDDEKIEREKKSSKGGMSPARCDVTRLLRQLCSGDPAGFTSERVSGAKNAQLLCVRGGSPPRQPSTPQLLRILEETIQKQSPRKVYARPRNPERYRLSFNISERSAACALHYRTAFVQHMLASALYANSAVGKPWEAIRSISDTIIDELLTSIAKEMEINSVIRELYKCETK